MQLDNQILLLYFSHPLYYFSYCMVVKVDVPPEEWICYDCTEDRDGVPEGEETSSMERRVESYIDFFKVITTIIQRIYTQKKLFVKIGCPKKPKYFLFFFSFL